MSRKPSINVVTFNEETGVIGYAWRMWWQRSSFYLVPRYAPMSGAKVSLHGPEEGNENGGFKLARDRAAMVRAEAAGGSVRGQQEALWFSGRPTPIPGVTHAVTLRWTPGLFRRGSPNGPGWDELKSGSLGLVVPAPAPGYAADVDIYVCTGQPWWPNEDQARRANAVLGPIGNAAGQFLTAVSVRRSVKDKPTPSAAIGPSPLSRKDFLRAIGAAVDDEGVIWQVEHWGSRKRLSQAAEASRAAIA